MFSNRFCAGWYFFFSSSSTTCNDVCTELYGGTLTLHRNPLAIAYSLLACVHFHYNAKIAHTDTPFGTSCRRNAYEHANSGDIERGLRQRSTHSNNNINAPYKTAYPFLNGVAVFLSWTSFFLRNPHFEKADTIQKPNWSCLTTLTLCGNEVRPQGEKRTLQAFNVKPQ